MFNLAVLTTTTGSNTFAKVAEPIVKLMADLRGPLIAIVVAVGAIYCIFLGAKLAKAEEPQEREKAKMALKNAIIGFILIFVLIVAMTVMVEPLTKWMETNAKTTTITK